MATFRITFCLFLIFVFTPILFADVIFEDGQSHIIDDYTYWTDFITLDQNVINVPGTHIELNPFGAVGDILLSNNSTANINFNASVGGRLVASDNSFVNINGGHIGWEVAASRNGQVIINGCYGLSGLEAHQNGKIYINGSNLKVTDLDGNVTDLKEGDKLSDFSTLVEWRPNDRVSDYHTGTVTGVLSDGSILNDDFRIWNQGFYEGTADIIIIPEPTSLAIFGFGSLLLRKRKMAVPGGKRMVTLGT